VYNRSLLPAEYNSRDIEREFERVEEAFNLFDLITLKELNTEPAKPRTGMVVLADGTNWNPGSGAGVYARYGGSWVKLG
jgi:hypothetical protein